MFTPERIEELYVATLEPRIRALESLRLSLKSYITKGLLCVAVPFALFFLSDFFTGGWSSAATVLVNVGSFGLIFVGVVFAGFKFLMPGITAYANYRSRFKHEVAAEVFKIVSPSATYSPTQGVAQADFDEPGLFNTRGNFTSDDRVHGTIGQTPFEAAEVRRSYSTGGKNSTTVVVFHGLFFHIDFNKSLRGTTIVHPEDASSSQLGSRIHLTKVVLENPAFEQAFAVHASDEVEARYILTPAMMEQILALRQRAGKPIFLAFKNHRAYLGVHYGRALFEPGIAATTSLESVQEMAAHFALAEGVIHELDLNTRIWTKGVDDALLKRAMADRPEDELDRLAAKGELTASQLWATATKAVSDDGGDGDDAVVTRPPATSIQIEHSAGTTTVAYGLSIGFYVTFVFWVASVAVALAALRLLPNALNAPDLSLFTSWIPAIPYASDLVASHPIPWAIAAWILGPLAFTIWTTRVRRVEITPSAVRVWRGFRPLPRTYPRPEYGKIVKLETAVYVGKSEGLHLMHPTASPMLSTAEAPWVAAEMRRGLRNSPPPR